MDDTGLPADALCERCWTQCLPGESYVRFGHIASVRPLGDVVWRYTFLHRYDPDEGCVRTA